MKWSTEHKVQLKYISSVKIEYMNDKADHISKDNRKHADKRNTTHNAKLLDKPPYETKLGISKSRYEQWASG